MLTQPAFGPSFKITQTKSNLRLLVLLVVTFNWSDMAAAAACSSTDYVLQTQAEVEALGATGCDSVSGYLEIRDPFDDVTNLNPLINLTKVGGNLVISDHVRLTSLDGLDNIHSVGGDLEILYAWEFKNLNGLRSLVSVAGSVYIYNNGLSNLDGLAKLTSVGGGLRILNNYALANLADLKGLNSLGGSLYIADNEKLSSLDGLKGLASIAGDAFIGSSGVGYSGVYTHLDGLANLATVGGDLFIGSMGTVPSGALANLDGLSNLTSVGGDLSIIRNGGNLDNCEGIAGLLGWPSGPPEDAVGGSIHIYENALGCNSTVEILNSYIPPTTSDKFNALMQTIQATRGAGGSQQTQATSESLAEADVPRQLAKEAGATVQARAAGSTGEPESIPVMPHYLMLMMACLVGLFGLRQFRA